MDSEVGAFGDTLDPLKYVLMPHFFRKRMLIEDESGAWYQMDRWELIKRELLYLRQTIMVECLNDVNPDLLTKGIESCILMYRLSDPAESNVNILGDALMELCRKSALDVASTILFIIDSALMLPGLFPSPVPLLNGQQENETTVKLLKEQICCILANAFFCTFPKRDGADVEYNNYPRINFNSLYDDSDNFGNGWRSKMRQAKVEKIKCFLNYFSRMKCRQSESSQPKPNEVIYERHSLSTDHIPDWEHVKLPFWKLSVFSEGVIEDQVETLQVDFANELVGGGTLGNGAAMEEIRFACCPELVAAQLFTKVLGPLDSLHVHQFEQFSSHKGYSASFKYTGSIQDSSVKDNHVVAMDAHRFRNSSIPIQLEKRNLNRELNKCVSSFQSSATFGLSTVSSGKWGCGVFNGDPLLKCLLQWMAASYCEKQLQLYTVGDKILLSNLEFLKNVFAERGTSLADLYVLLIEYGQQGRHRQKTLFNFLKFFLMPEPELTETEPELDEPKPKSTCNSIVRSKSWWQKIIIVNCLFKNVRSAGYKVWHLACFVVNLGGRLICCCFPGLSKGQ